MIHLRYWQMLYWVSMGCTRRSEEGCCDNKCQSLILRVGKWRISGRHRPKWALHRASEYKPQKRTMCLLNACCVRWVQWLVYILDCWPRQSWELKFSCGLENCFRDPKLSDGILDFRIWAYQHAGKTEWVQGGLDITWGSTSSIAISPCSWIFRMVSSFVPYIASSWLPYSKYSLFEMSCIIWSWDTK